MQPCASCLLNRLINDKLGLQPGLGLLINDLWILWALHNLKAVFPMFIIIIIIYLLKDDTVKPARITVQRAGQQGVIIRTYKMPQNTQLHKYVSQSVCIT